MSQEKKDGLLLALAFMLCVAVLLGIIRWAQWAISDLGSEVPNHRSCHVWCPEANRNPNGVSEPERMK